MPISVTAAMMMPMKMMSPHHLSVDHAIGEFARLAGHHVSVEGSTPIARAGAASVSRLIHSSCVASSGTVTLGCLAGQCRGSRRASHRRTR